MFIWKALLLAFAISFLPTFIYTFERESFEMYFDSIDCNVTDQYTYLSMLNCFVSKNTKRRTFSIELQFKEDIPEFYMNMLVVLPRKSNDFVLLNLTRVDGCQLLSNKNQVTFVQVGRSMLDRFSNVPHSCPFRKDVFYYVRGFRFDMSAMPAFNFEAPMNLWFEISNKRQSMFKAYLKSRIIVKRNNKRRAGN